MTTYIALLRGINVGGHKPVAMSDLRGLLEELGFSDVRTLLQTGNLVFAGGAGSGGARSGGARSAGALERLLETEAAKRLDLQTTFLVRAANEWQAVIADNPFREEAKSDPSHLVVAFLKDAPQASAVRSLQAAIRGPEIVRSQGKQLYIVYPAGIGRSKFTNKLIEDTLETRTTGRNWNTVLKIAALAGP